MTQMIYRLETPDNWFEGRGVLKTKFKNVPCDALIVNAEEVTGLCQGDWFTDPNELISRLEDAKVQQFEAPEEAPKKRGRPKKEQEAA